MDNIINEFPKLDYFIEYIDYWANENPDFSWIQYHNQNLTARVIKKEIDAYCQFLLRLGMQKGDILVSILPNCPEFLYFFFASQKIGVVFVPLDVRYKQADLEEFFRQTQPKLAVYIPEFKNNKIEQTLNKIKPQFTSSIQYISVNPLEFRLPSILTDKTDRDWESQLEDRQNQVHLDDDALVIFTGGTTGRPKGALLSHRNISTMLYYEMQHIASQMYSIGIKGRPSFYQGLPNTHVGGILEMNGFCFILGMQMILDDTWSATHQLQVISDLNSPIFGGVPTMAAMMLNIPELMQYNLSALKIAVLSGEKLKLKLLQSIKEKLCPYIINGYGSSEAGAEIAMTSIHDSIALLAQGFAGMPLPEMKVKILDAEGNDCHCPCEGQLAVSGPYTMKEYFNLPDQTKESFTEDGWYLTGDRAFIDESGRITIQDRIKQIIRVGSYTVLHSEIENVLIQDPSVLMAAAVGYSDEIYNEVVWAVVVPRPNTHLDIERLYNLCKANLANFKVPKKILVQPSIPQTHLGKIDRKQLLKHILQQQGEEN